MKHFTDTAGRKWTTAMTVGDARRVKTELDIDLLDTAKFPETVNRLAIDRLALCGLIFSAVKPQAEAQQVTEEDFWKAMDGDVLDAALSALVEGMVDFFPFAQRATLTKTWAKIQALYGIAVKRADDELESGKIEAQLESILNQSGSSSSSSPGSSGSTPTH